LSTLIASLLLLVTTVHALTFNFEFDDSVSSEVTPPIVGTGSFIITGDPGDGDFAFNDLSPTISFTVGGETFTNAHIATPLNNIQVRISTTALGRGVTFGGTSGGPSGGSIDFVQGTHILSFQPGFGNLYLFGNGPPIFFGSFGTSTSTPSTANGDPHLTGAGGIKFDFEGVANGAYSLFVTPMFAINMLLAPVGPKKRFIHEIGILAGGKSITFGPWAFKSRREELTTMFESVGATVEFHRGTTMTLTFCDNHVLALTTRHSAHQYNHHLVNFFDVSVTVPGCHDDFDGALGTTYHCEFALGHTPFGRWTREREETFRIANLTTSTGAYSPKAKCPHHNAAPAHAKHHADQPIEWDDDAHRWRI
jgi:hypothetical protein